MIRSARRKARGLIVSGPEDGPARVVGGIDGDDASGGVTDMHAARRDATDQPSHDPDLGRMTDGPAIGEERRVAPPYAARAPGMSLTTPSGSPEPIRWRQAGTRSRMSRQRAIQRERSGSLFVDQDRLPAGSAGKARRRDRPASRARSMRRIRSPAQTRWLDLARGAVDAPARARCRKVGCASLLKE